MRRRLIVFMAIVLGHLSSFGQSVEISEAGKEYNLFEISERLVFELEEEPSIDEILKMDWKAPNDLILDQKNTRSAYYLKVRIKNQLQRNLISHVYYVSLNRLSVYQVIEGEVIEYIDLGIYSDQSEFPFLHSAPVLELKDTDGMPFDLILRLEGVQTAHIPWFISTVKPFLEVRHFQDLFYGLVYGLLLLVVVYNLSLYYRLRELDNLIYALWVFFIAFHLSFFNGFVYEFLWPKFRHEINLVDVIGAISGALHIVFAIVFLKVKWNRLAGKIALIIVLWYAASIVVTLTGYSEAFFPWMNPVVIVMIEGIFCLVLGTAALIKGFKPALYFLLANIFFFILIGVVISYGTGNSEHSFISYNGFQVGSALVVLFFSFGLSYKVRLLKKDKDEALKETAKLATEKEKIVREQNIVLEEKVQERTRELSEEKEKSDKLLLNILPERTAQELKKTGKAKARRFDDVTIMFCDFVGFTKVSEALSPEKLVELIDHYFRHFDDIIGKYGLEKIKTIGDAYMAVANLPEENEQGAKDMLAAALEIQKFMDTERKQRGEMSFDLRLGINTGSVVAGVVGSRKFQFDIWGDAVNIAARMEQNCEPGMVNITESTKEACEGLYRFESRGKIEAKNKGELEMFYVFEN